MSSIQQRTELLNHLIGPEVPRLWCPPITHYTPDGQINRDRMASHWKWMSRSVRGFLVPGSTGDAWEMSDAEQDQVIEIALDLAQRHQSLLLLGALKPTAAAMRESIERTLQTLKTRSGLADPIAAMKACRVCCFIIAAPHGKELSQDQIESELVSVLEMKIPVSLYQLPQITQNEISPQVVARLANRYPHILLFKDTSGTDVVAMERLDLGGLFMVRGGEGDYAKWLTESGGPYQGLLLSTANSFPGELKSVIDLLQTRQAHHAADLSQRLTRAVQQAFAIVADMKDGNAFANANKAIDHQMAFGSIAARIAPPPRLHAGSFMPREVIDRVRDELRGESLLKTVGYLGAAG